MGANVTSVTIAEDREIPTREKTLQRLRDWQQRVHALYDQIQAALGPGFSYDRTGKHRSSEERVQHAGLKSQEVPPIDILIVDQAGRAVAQFLPRGLWMIGANGRLDLVLTPKSGNRQVFMLIDHSAPLSGGSDWRIVRPSDRLQQRAFKPEHLRELVE